MSDGNNGKVLTVSRKLAKILTFSRKSHHPIETLKKPNGLFSEIGQRRKILFMQRLRQSL